MSASFNPSDVVCAFHNSSLRKGEKETVAAYVLRFLAEKHGDTFTEFPAKAFFKYMKEGCPQNAHPIYYQMMNGPFVRGVIAALGEMIHNEGYLTYRSEGETEYLAPTEKLIQFYWNYIPEAEIVE